MSAIKTLLNDKIHPDLEYDYFFDGEPSTPKAKAKEKPRFRIDLAGQQAECEANFYRLLKLLPNIEQCDDFKFEIGAGPIAGTMTVNIIDRAPYTLTLKISQIEKNNTWAKAPTLTVCMYKDVKLAEVIACQNHKRLSPRYEYPNPDMYHCNEKDQLNQFLREWLTLCQSHGRSAITMSDLGLNELKSKI